MVNCWRWLHSKVINQEVFNETPFALHSPFFGMKSRVKKVLQSYPKTGRHILINDP